MVALTWLLWAKYQITKAEAEVAEEVRRREAVERELEVTKAHRDALAVELAWRRRDRDGGSS